MTTELLMTAELTASRRVRRPTKTPVATASAKSTSAPPVKFTQITAKNQTAALTAWMTITRVPVVGRKAARQGVRGSRKVSRCLPDGRILRWQLFGHGLALLVSFVTDTEFRSVCAPTPAHVNSFAVATREVTCCGSPLSAPAACGWRKSGRNKDLPHWRLFTLTKV